MEFTSCISGFYDLTIDQRVNKINELIESNQTPTDFWHSTHLSRRSADSLIENVVGVFGLPLGLAFNFKINKKDYIIPLAIEEPSVVAAASHGAKFIRNAGGFSTSSDPSLMIGQLQLLNCNNPNEIKHIIESNKSEIIRKANQFDSKIIELGGGAKDVEVRILRDPETLDGNNQPVNMVIIHILVDTKDAMGANIVNTTLEGIAPFIEKLTGKKINIKILSNLSDRRLARSECRIPIENLSWKEFSGEQVAKGIVLASRFAALDPYRAATNNKGIMNSIDPLMIATGNDWRAIEAGAHAHIANKHNRYTSFSTWKIEQGSLVGKLELPFALGIVGGSTKHPMAKFSLRLLNVKSAGELAQVAASVGLASNFSALKALSTEGIQKGHMRLHKRKIK